MDNYEIKKEPTQEQLEFNKEAKSIFDEIQEVLKKHPGWDLIPTLVYSEKGIQPSISMEKKPKEKSPIVVPEIPLIVPK